MIAFSELDELVKTLARQWKNREPMDVEGFGILEMTMPQRAIIAARLNSLYKGSGSRSYGVPTVTVVELFQVKQDTLTRVKGAVLWTTPEIIESLWSGKISIREASRNQKREKPATRPTRTYDTERSFRSELYQKLKSTLFELNSFPSAIDVAVIAKDISRGPDLDAKLGSALRWLEEFSNEWRNLNGQTPA